VWVDGDPVRLAQVLDNLLANAAKFTDRGGRVVVRLAAEGGPRRAVVAVCDDGIGIEADMLARVFDPFAQADRSLDRSRGGLGLGLALVKGLVELHGGGVAAASDGPGRGTEVTLWLPLAAGGTTATAGLPPACRGPGQRVLIVEDNADAAESLRLLLEAHGHRVAVAATGPAGVEAALRAAPEVVLCDLGLPGMSGFEVARTLRADPATAAALLVAVSGYGHEDDRQRSREAGFERHLVKPVDPTDILRLLASARAAGSV
jgi:CheY-like chemotaxis protein